MIRWGILGCGHIAAKFAEALRVVPGAKLWAVASRSKDRAREFCEKHDAAAWYGDYDALAADRKLDVVYIATPHVFHKPHAILCLNNGKHVLCEKPLAINQREAADMAAVARKQKRFLMEAMWTGFLPVIREVRALLADGIIGEVRILTADFGFRAPFDPRSRLFDPALGGGSLLDVGVYCAAFANMIFAKSPTSVLGAASLSTTGVDERMTAVLRYDGERTALLSSSISADTLNEAYLIGTAGAIRIPRFWRAVSATVFARKTRDIAIPFRANGYEYEAEEVMRCIREGKKESETMPPSDSIAVLTIMDSIRAQYGLTYPAEQ
jgi:dihydrodiol dehydrogenase / D-xylose 1-dehydrogenase (NADP)